MKQKCRVNVTVHAEDFVPMLNVHDQLPVSRIRVHVIFVDSKHHLLLPEQVKKCVCVCVCTHACVRACEHAPMPMCTAVAALTQTDLSPYTTQ